MRPIKLKCKSQINNPLGFKNIEIIESRISVKTKSIVKWGDKEREGTYYEYEYVAIADNQLIIICDGDFEFLSEYEVIG